MTKADDDRDRLLRILICPECKGERMITKSGLVCSSWDCGKLYAMTSKQIADLRLAIRVQDKRDKKLAEEEAARADHLRKATEHADSVEDKSF